jgi:hypothetical protein
MKKLFVLIAIGMIVVLIMRFPHAMISPGELAAGHQKLNNECFDCHKPFGGISNDKCISCHKLTEIGNDSLGKNNKINFHEKLSSLECSSCHSEHQGKFPKTKINSFKHDLLSVDLMNNCNSCHAKPTNKLHLQVTTKCISCHSTSNWKNAIQFNHEEILNSNSCASCHKKPNDNFHSIISNDCMKCHTTQQWVPSTFDHTKYFRLDGNHNATCVTCHQNNNLAAYTCFGCHEHAEVDVIAEHNEEGIYNISDCASCHKSGSEHDIIYNEKNLKREGGNKMEEIMKSNNHKESDDE